MGGCGTKQSGRHFKNNKIKIERNKPCDYLLENILKEGCVNMCGEDM